MSGPMTVDSVLCCCRSAVESAADGDLPWSWRIRLWDAFNREYPADSLLRRQVLAFIAAAETLPAFREIEGYVPHRMRKYPKGFLRDTGRLLLGEIAEPETKVAHFQNDIEYAMALYELGNGVYSIIATYAALPAEIERQEHLYRENEYARAWDPNYRLIEADDEWTCWETHYWAAIVAGGSPGTQQFEVERHRDFWLRWLRERIPKVRGALTDVMELMKAKWSGLD